MTKTTLYIIYSLIIGISTMWYGTYRFQKYGDSDWRAGIFSLIGGLCLLPYVIAVLVIFVMAPVELFSIIFNLV